MILKLKRQTDSKWNCMFIAESQMAFLDACVNILQTFTFFPWSCFAAHDTFEGRKTIVIKILFTKH